MKRLSSIVLIAEEGEDTINEDSWEKGETDTTLIALRCSLLINE